MRKMMMPAAMVLLLMACGHGAQSNNHFAASDGSVQAVCKNDKWTITDSIGREPMADYDSMRVLEVGADGHPMTVVYYKGTEQYHLQYYSTMRLRSEGRLVDGMRQGRWVFYHPNGLVQVEAIYRDGKEDGPYRVYRDNGAPFYIGQYEQGTPTGQWEVYDMEGNLVESREY